MPGSVIPRRGGCFEEAVPDLFSGPCRRGTVRLDHSDVGGLRASEKQTVFIVDIERLDLITTSARCRENFVSARDLWAGGGRRNSLVDES